MGSQAVWWMIQNDIASSVPEALKIGDLLIDHGVFSHVAKAHMFENEYLFYRFAQDWPSPSSGVTDHVPKRLQKLCESVVHSLRGGKAI